MARLIIFAGIVLVIVGLCWPLLGGLIDRLGFGRLPGDIIVESERSKFFFPIVSCLVLSAVVSLLFWMIQK